MKALCAIPCAQSVMTRLAQHFQAYHCYGAGGAVIPPAATCDGVQMQEAHHRAVWAAQPGHASQAYPGLVRYATFDLCLCAYTNWRIFG